VALKVLTADSYGTENDIFELSILEHIRVKDVLDPGINHILGLIDSFRHHGPHGEHICLVFKAMGPDLAIYRKLFPQLQIPPQTLKQVARQLLQALAYLHQSCGIIRTAKSIGVWLQHR
jgi:serine/threonine-protein kinase SRPK3